MSRGFASVSLVGNLTRDPELKQTPAGKSVCQLGVAVGRSYKDASGQWVEATSFFDVVVWGAQGEACAQHLAKGRQIAVSGRLEQQRWQNEMGENRSRVSIVADQVVFVGGRQEPSAAAAGTPADDFGDDDDLPF